MHIHANVRLSCGFITLPPSPKLLSLCCPSPRITNGANYFLQNPFRELSSGEFVRVHLCTLVAKHEREGVSKSVSFEGSSNIQFKISSRSAASLISLWSTCSVGKVSAVNLSSHSLWVIVCLSGHAGNSVEAALNNNNNPCIWEGGVTGRGCLSLNSLSISCFPWFIGRVFHQLIFMPTLYKLCAPTQLM